MTVKWALIGASDICATRMIPAVRALGQEPLIVQSASAERAEQFATLNELPAYTTSVEDAVQAEVDAVFTSFTNDRHFAQTMAAIGAGRHVLCEKPLALSVDDALAAAAAAEAASVTLATNHHLRHSPVHRLVRSLVADGRLESYSQSKFLTRSWCQRGSADGG